MAMERFTVTNLENWGNLVKSWSKGTKPWPTNLQELQAQCDAAGAGAYIPPYVTSLQLVQAPTEATLLLRIPPRKILQDSEDTLNAGGAYSIPKFYNRLFNQPVGPTIPLADNMKVHAERIGDYTMSNCV